MEETTRMDKTLRQIFKRFNPLMLLNWRLGLGPWLSLWPEVTGRYLVITHTGRKTGLRRRTPVNYAQIDGEIYCTAGFGPISDWYRNILKNPQVEVWLPDGWWRATAEDVSESPQRLQIMRQVLIGSGLAAFLFGINPHRLSDEKLAEVTKNYRLVRIRREAPCTGPDGPGDLVWIWPVLVLLLLRRPRRR